MPVAVLVPRLPTFAPKRPTPGGRGAVSRPAVDRPWPCSRRTQLHCRLECLAECQLTAVQAVKLDGNLSVAIFRLVPSDCQMSAADRAGRPGDSSADVVTHVVVPHGTPTEPQGPCRRFDCPFGRRMFTIGVSESPAQCHTAQRDGTSDLLHCPTGTVPQAAFKGEGCRSRY